MKLKDLGILPEKKYYDSNKLSGQVELHKGFNQAIDQIGEIEIAEAHLQWKESLDLANKRIAELENNMLSQVEIDEEKVEDIILDGLVVPGINWIIRIPNTVPSDIAKALANSDCIRIKGDI